MLNKTKLSRAQLNKFVSYLSDNFIYLFLFYFLVQLSLLFRFPVQYVSDSAYYWNLAQDCIRAKGFYPLPQHIFEYYIAAPLYINVIVILLNIYNSTLTIGIFNIILNSFQLFLLYKITCRILNEKAAVITALFYILYLNNAGLVLVNLTELFYTTLVLLSIYFYLKEGKYNLLAAGFFCGASIAVRPLGWALFIAYLIVAVYKYSRGKRLLNLSFITFGLACFIIVFGSLIKIYSGYFIYTSTTGPINILMSANDKATGAFIPDITGKDNPGYIPGDEKLNFLQKHDTLENRASSWIKDHPLKWLSLIPNKILLLFRWDDVSVSRLISYDFNFQTFVKVIRHDPSITRTYSRSFLFLWLMLIIFHHLVYFSALLLFVIGLIKFSHEIIKNNYLKLFLIYASIGILITLASHTGVRYKYPYMFVIFICNSYFVSALLKPEFIKRKSANPPVQF